MLAGKPFSELLAEDRDGARSARTFKGVRVNQLPDVLARALESLQPGETTKAPLQTRFGWHVLHLDATHPFTPPTFEALKKNIRHSELEAAAERRLAQLRAKATITPTTPPVAGSDTAPSAAAPPTGSDPASSGTDNESSDKHN